MQRSRLEKFFFFLLLFLLPWGQFTRIPVGSLGLPDVSVYLNDLILPLLHFIFLFRLCSKKKKIFFPPFAGWLFLFVFIAGLSLLNGFRWLGLTEFVISFLYLWRWVMYALLFVEVLTWLKEESLKIEMVFQWFLGGGVLFAFLGFLQFIFFPNFSQFVQHGWDPHYYRLLSAFFDPNFAGMYLIFCFLLLLVFWLEKKGSRLIVGCLLIFTGTAIVLTFSRSVYLALIVGLIFLSLWRSPWILMVGSFCGLLIFATVPRVQNRIIGAVSLDETAQARINDWRKTGEIIEDNWLIGVGFNSFRYAQERYGYFRDGSGLSFEGGHAGSGADSSLLFIWATTGIFGLINYLIIWGIIWLKAVLFWRQKSHKQKIICLWLIVVIPAWMAHAQFVNSLFFTWIMEIMWIMSSLIFAEEKA